MKKFLLLVFSFFIMNFFSICVFSFDENETCTLTYYNNGEVQKIEKDYNEIAPLIEKILYSTFDANLNLLMSDQSVEDMKNVGEHIEIQFQTPRVFSSQNSHLTYIAYKTFVVKENSTSNSLPTQKIFLTFQDMPLVRGIGSIEVNPKIINLAQRRIRVITGDSNGYAASPRFSFGTDNEYKILINLFSS